MRSFGRHWPPLLALFAVSLLQLRQLAFEGRVLVGYDALTYFYPNEQLAAATLRSGALPLWNPYLFTGVPFLANVQTGVFYPLNLLFLLAPAPTAYAYSVVLHVVLSAVFAYAFGVAGLGLRRTAAFVLGATYALGGFLTALAGHLNQLQASVWLPLILLLAGQCYRRGSPRWAALGALAVATQFLAGHMQEFYISTAGVAAFLAWLIVADLLKPRAARAAGPAAAAPTVITVPSATPTTSSRVISVGVMFGVGAALTAVQTLPAYELTRESIRSGGLGYWDAIPFSLPPWMMLRALLPAHVDPQPLSEWIGYVGVVPLVLAAFGLLRSRHHVKLLFGLVAVVALLLALGQYTGVYQAAYFTIPGVKLFRVPARWLLLYSFALSTLAALGTEAALRQRPAGKKAVRLLWPTAAVLLGFAALLVALATAFNPGAPVELPSLTVVLLWTAAALAALGVLALALAGRRALAGLALAALVAVELLAAGWRAEVNRANLPEAVTALRPAIASLLSRPGLFRVLPFSEGVFDPGDLAQLRVMAGRTLPPESAYDYVVATKHKETLTPNLPLLFGLASLDGYDGGILPLRRYVAFKRLLPLATPNVPDGRLREQLHAVPDAKLLGWLNVRYVLTDRTHDAWIDGVYYDLGLSTAVRSGAGLRLAAVPAQESTAIGVVSHLEGASLVPDGTPVARLVVTLDDGQVLDAPLRAGVDTAEARYGSREAAAHRQARKARPLRDQQNASDYVAQVRLPRPSFIRELRVIAADNTGTFVLRGLSLIDDRRRLDQPVAIDPSYRIVHLGDVKIYENEAALPRAFLVHDTLAAASDDDALAKLAEPGFDPTATVILDAKAPPLPPQPRSTTADTVTIEEYRPELVRVLATSDRAGALVLTDSYYPGWRALVDGKPAELLRADYLFRAVLLPAGQHEVTFVYDPPSLKVGAAITAAALLALLGTAFAVPLSRLASRGQQGRRVRKP